MAKPTKFYTITVPTKTYLKKYIENKYGAPIPVNNNSLIGVLMITLLEKRICTRLPSFDKDIRYTSFVDHLEFIAPFSNMKDYGYDLTTDNIIQINRYFEHEFEERLYFHCHQSTLKHRKKAIEEFALRHGIEPDIDITMDCLIKSEYRKRIELEKNFRRNVHPTNQAFQTSLL